MEDVHAPTTSQLTFSESNPIMMKETIPFSKLVQPETSAKAGSALHFPSTAPASPHLTTSKLAKWLPAGFRTPRTLSEGKHTCEILNVGEFINKFNEDYSITLDLRTTTSQEGTIRLPFSNDPKRMWISNKSSTVITTLLTVVGMHVEPATRLNFHELTRRLRDVRFQIEVASSPKGWPYLIRLEPVSDINQLSPQPVTQAEAHLKD